MLVKVQLLSLLLLHVLRWLNLSTSDKYPFWSTALEKESQNDIQLVGSPVNPFNSNLGRLATIFSELLPFFPLAWEATVAWVLYALEPRTWSIFKIISCASDLYFPAFASSSLISFSIQLSVHLNSLNYPAVPQSNFEFPQVCLLFRLIIG